jgi:hypothetical protein
MKCEHISSGFSQKMSEAGLCASGASNRESSINRLKFMVMHKTKMASNWLLVSCRWSLFTGGWSLVTGARVTTVLSLAPMQLKA